MSPSFTKIKIIHLQVLPIMSGAQNMMLSLLTGLDSKKYEICVVSRGDGPLVDAVRAHGWDHIAIDSLCRELSLKDFKTAFKLFLLFKKKKPDIVHSHSSKTGFLGRIISKLCGVPLVIHTIHGFPFHPYQNGISKTCFILLESFAAFFADFNVFMNKYEREMSIHKLGFNKKKSVLIYNGIPVAPLTKTYDECFLKNDQLSIVSVARFSKQKNVISTIEQAIKVVKKHEHVLFTFFGDGELYAECQNIINKNKVSDRIMLHGWAENVLERLLEFDVFLLNSLWEGLSISILEAMSVGLPIICSDIKGNNELVDDHNGWLIEPYDLGALEKVISEILNNKNVLSIKGEESIKKVTKQFYYELFVNEYENLYNCLR